MTVLLNPVSSPRRSIFSPRTLRSLLFAAAAIAVNANAQDLTIKAPPQKGLTAVVGATIHPVSGPDIDNASIWFIDGTIAGIGSAKDYQDFLSRVRLSSPPTTIDAKGLHVYPGLISVYSQVGLVEFPPVTPTVDSRETGDITPEVRPCIAVNPDSTVIPVTRSNGVLLAGLFPTGGTIPGQVSVIRLDGWTMPDMTVRPGVGVVVRWPAMRSFTPPWMEQPSDEDQARNLRAGQTAIVQAFDAAEAYRRAREGDANYPIDLRWEAMRDLWAPMSDGATSGSLRERPKSLFILANDIDQINAAVTFAVERGVRPVIVGGQDAPRCADLLKKHDVPVIAMGTHRMPRRSDSPYDDGYALPRELHAAGLRFAIANNDDVAHDRNTPYAAGMAVAHGLPHDVALRSITLSAAEILGVQNTYGSLEQGKSATLLITTGDPMEVTTHIRFAFIDGRQIDLTNKQTKLYDKYKERYRQTGDLRGD